MGDPLRGRRTPAPPLPRGPSAATTVAPIVVVAPRRSSQGLGGPVERILDTGRAGLSGALDGATMGLADLAIASAKAGLGFGRGGGFIERMRNNLTEEAARDRADRQAHPYARRIGQGVGAIGTMLAPELAVAAALARAGGAARLAAAAPRALAAVAKDARVIARGGRAVAGRMKESGVGHLVRPAATMGAVGGLAGQGAADVIAGDFGGIPAYAGALAAGGLAGGAAPFVGAPIAAGLSGAAIPALQAGLGGRIPDLDEMYSGALYGAAGGRLSAHGATNYSNRLSIKAKGKLGERLSALNALLRFEAIARDSGKRHMWVGGPTHKETIPDVITNSRVVEAKFNGGRLRPAQKKAYRGAIKDYHVENWLGRDVGDEAAAGASALLSSLQSRRRP